MFCLEENFEKKYARIFIVFGENCAFLKLKIILIFILKIKISFIFLLLLSKNIFFFCLFFIFLFIFNCHFSIFSKKIINYYINIKIYIIYFIFFNLKIKYSFYKYIFVITKFFCIINNHFINKLLFYNIIICNMLIYFFNLTLL